MNALKVGMSRLPPWPSQSQREDSWTIEVIIGKNSAASLEVVDGEIVSICHLTRAGTREVDPGLAKEIRSRKAEILKIAVKRPFNAYRIFRAAPIQIYFETQITKTGFRGRMIGYKCISDPAVRARAGLHYMAGVYKVYSESFILEDPVNSIILVPEHTTKTRDEWALAALDTLTSEGGDSVGLTSWVEMDYIDSRDQYVAKKMQEVLKRTLQT